MIETRVLTGEALGAALEDVARLRITVFRDWPYLYEGDLAYERDYLQPYQNSATAIVVGAFDGARLVGAATGTGMEDHAADFAAPLSAAGYDLPEVFYCAESVLLPAYRGQGIGHRFFDAREAKARDIGRRYSAFCSVVRPMDHPKRPHDYRPLDEFWRKRDYDKISGVFAKFSWLDVGKVKETTKPLQVWIKDLRR